jgi:hypothetical protein
MPALQTAPTFFRQKGYSCPVDQKDGMIQFAFGGDKSSFEHLQSDPLVSESFNAFMGHTMGARKHWVDWYPVKSRVLEDASNDTVLIVDVGGGKGHDLLEFRQKYPNSGRMILEDLPVVLETVEDLDAGIEVIEYDFFAEQPVQGEIDFFLLP